MHVKNSSRQLWTTEPQFHPHLGLLLSIPVMKKPLLELQPPNSTLAQLYSVIIVLLLFLYYLWIIRTFGSYVLIHPAAASSHDKIHCCLCNGCYFFLLPFFQEQWKCIPCITPTPVSFQHSHVLVFSLFWPPPGTELVFWELPVCLKPREIPEWWMGVLDTSAQFISFHM